MAWRQVGVWMYIHLLAQVSVTFTLFMQDEDEIIGTAVMPYSEFVTGVVGLNYRKEPLLALGQNSGDLFHDAIQGEPATPLLEAFVGDPIGCIC